MSYKKFGFLVVMIACCGLLLSSSNTRAEDVVIPDAPVVVSPDPVVVPPTDPVVLPPVENVVPAPEEDVLPVVVSDPSPVVPTSTDEVVLPPVVETVVPPLESLAVATDLTPDTFLISTGLDEVMSPPSSVGPIVFSPEYKNEGITYIKHNSTISASVNKINSCLYRADDIGDWTGGYRSMTNLFGSCFDLFTDFSSSTKTVVIRGAKSGPGYLYATTTPVVVDDTAPTFSYSLSADSPRLLSLKCSDGSGSGCKANTVFYCFPNSADKCLGDGHWLKPYTAPILFGDNTKIKVFGSDNLNNLNLGETMVIDVTAPVITVLGSDPVNVFVGDIYVDAGATSTDDGGSGLDGDIKVVSDVNMSIAGSYTVTYNISDKAGNVAEQKTRTVVVSNRPAEARSTSGNYVSGYGFGRVLGTSIFRFTHYLELGMRDNDVKELQRRLRSEGFYKGYITGYFSASTEAALRAYQEKHKLVVTGTVNKQTRAELNGLTVDGVKI
jgi:hypothetical protein